MKLRVWDWIKGLFRPSESVAVPADDADAIRVVTIVPAGWPLVYVADGVLEETARVLTSYGTRQRPHEGVAYWAGVANEKALVVTTVLAPEAETSPGSFHVSAVANALIVAEANRHQIQILAQIHGHPGEWVGHSGGDNAGAFMPYSGFYSVVVPCYGRKGLAPLSCCGIHRFENGEFVRLSDEDIERQFVLLPVTVDLRARNGGTV